MLVFYYTAIILLLTKYMRGALLCQHPVTKSVVPTTGRIMFAQQLSALVQSVERSASVREVTGSIPALATASSGQFAKFGVSVISVS